MVSLDHRPAKRGTKSTRESPSSHSYWGSSQMKVQEAVRRVGPGRHRGLPMMEVTHCPSGSPRRVRFDQPVDRFGSAVAGAGGGESAQERGAPLVG